MKATLLTPLNVSHLGELFAARSDSDPVLEFPGGANLGYGALRQAIALLDKCLVDLGVEPEDTVVILAREGPLALLATLVAATVAVAAPLNPALAGDEILGLLKTLDPRVLLIDDSTDTTVLAAAGAAAIEIIRLPELLGADFSRLANASGERAKSTLMRRPGDISLILATSGTTGDPRLVALTHGQLLHAASSIASTLQLAPSDRYICVLPAYHIHGFSTVLAALVSRGTVIYAGRTGGQEYLKLLGSKSITWTSATPTHYQALLNHLYKDPGSDHLQALASSLRLLRTASAPMSTRLMQQLQSAFSVPVVQAYGMTEAASLIASNGLDAPGRRHGSVGRPGAIDVAVVDEQGSEVSMGDVGEIVIRGDSVIRSYYLSVENDNSFLPEGWLRSGDLGYLDTDGFLYITGRKKDIINCGGEKIAPYQVEAVLLQHPAVEAAVVFGVPHETLGEIPCAAVVLRAGFDPAADDTSFRAGLVVAIKTFCAAYLADFKIPQSILPLPELPARTDGKLRRQQLHHLLASEQGPSFKMRTDPSELLRCIREAWSDVLSASSFGDGANFFLIGGDSLSATQVCNRLCERFGLALSANFLFKYPTILQQASRLSELCSDEHKPQTGALAAAADDAVFAYVAPLSRGQRRLWFLDQAESGAHYTMCAALRLRGELDSQTLERAIKALSMRHAALRTTIRQLDGEPVQVIASGCAIALARVDLSSTPAVERPDQAQLIAARERNLPFVLPRGPLFRATLITLDERQHVLVLTLHHIICDGWSVGVLHRDLLELYASMRQGRPAALEPLLQQYSDYARADNAQDRFLAGLAQADWWRRELLGVRQSLLLPASRAQLDGRENRGARCHFHVPATTTAALEALAARFDTTLYVVLVAALQILLYRYTGQDNFCIGTAVANRRHKQLEPLIGFFANTLPLATRMVETDRIDTAIARARHTVSGALQHDDIDFGQIVEAVCEERTAGQTPLFQVMFAFQNLPQIVAAGDPASLAAEAFVVDGDTAKFPLTLYLRPAADGLQGIWQYRTDTLDGGSVGCLLDHFNRILDAMIDDPVALVVDITLKSQPVPETIAGVQPGAAGGVPNTLLLDAIARHASQNPNAIALSCDSQRISYAALLHRVNQLAHLLIHHGVGRGRHVAIVLPRDCSMPIAALAVLATGAAFLPLDCAYPRARMSGMLCAAGSDLIIVNGATRGMFASGGQFGDPALTLFCLEENEPQMAAQPTTSPQVATAAHDLAYILFTSGSTGSPKGVKISRGNLAHYIVAMSEALEIAAADKYLHTASFSFSSSIRQYALALANGAEVVIAQTHQVKNAEQLLDLIDRSGVSIVDLVPTHWRSVLQWLELQSNEDYAPALPHLRLLLTASEPLAGSLANSLMNRWPHGQLLNMYGQTETTGIVAINPVRDGSVHSGNVALGRPIAFTAITLLDENLRPVPFGATGEICISGECVGAGYLASARAVEDSFVQPGESDHTAQRFYRTGDLGRYRQDGTLEILGRRDAQIKYRGFRIEPGDIESVAMSHPAISEAAVTLATVGATDAAAVAELSGATQSPLRLQLIYSLANPQARAQTDSTVLRSYLGERLPGYMVPSQMIEVAGLPRTVSGKVDRNALHSVSSAAVPTVAEGDAVAVNPVRSKADEIGHKLGSIWREILGADVVTMHDNFFDLGGNSISSVEVVSAALDAGLNLSLEQLFRHQTLAELIPVMLANRDAATAQRAVRDPQPAAATVRPAGAGREAAPRFCITSLREFSLEALQKVGLAAEGAKILTTVQLEASLRGQPTHNIGDIPRYAKRLASGILNPDPDIQIADTSALSALVDGDNGPGQWVATIAMDKAIALARSVGAAIVSVRRSNHYGAAGHYAWQAGCEGMIGICLTNGPVILAPTGGVTPLFGNNPLAISLPCAGRDPVVLDMAMSVATRGKIGLAVAEGEGLQPGWILDRLGLPTTDLQDLAVGLGVPIGGHKGYGLAFAIEALAGALSGAGYCADHGREASARHGGSDIGHLFIVLDPVLFMARSVFEDRVADMVRQAKGSELAAGVSEIFVPGEIELNARTESLRRGATLSESTVARLTEYGKRHGLAASIKRLD
jgi:amino acid adenylation domain-containing protein